MSAIHLIAASSMLEITRAYFYGESIPSADTPLKPHETPENRAGVSVKTQCPCGFAGAETPDTPETCQKTEVEVKTTKRSLKWASAM
ncbi:hypothetical protein [Simplicispira metamorpha]|uniref:hypothetical protein n=1 Tax=Simplicispira metamorpha TaxID=80881 RepID=UPI001043464C|nr:hypothetical protein [Simplicispira metamorpha]